MPTVDYFPLDSMTPLTAAATNANANSTKPTTSPSSLTNTGSNNTAAERAVKVTAMMVTTKDMADDSIAAWFEAIAKE